MRIAICDDDTALLTLLEGYLHNFSIEKSLELTVDSFSGRDALLAGDVPITKYDVFFMDIYLTKDGIRPEGIDIIRGLNLSRKQQVVFITTSKEHAVEAFGLNAAHYLVKPLCKEQVDEAMERCLERLGKSLAKTLNVKTKQGTVPIPEENIIYIEVFNKVSHIQTSINSIQTYASLDSLFELLDTNTFLRPQRSFIVNMNYIKEFFFDRLVMSDGKEITLSRNNRAELKERYQRFLFDLARRGEI